MSQPTKKRKIVIEVEDGEDILVTMETVKQKISESKNNEFALMSLQNFRDESLQFCKDSLRERITIVFKRMTDLRYYTSDMTKDISAKRDRFILEAAKLPQEAFLLPGAQTIEEMAKPFDKLTTKKECLVAIAQGVLILAESFKD